MNCLRFQKDSSITFQQRGGSGAVNCRLCTGSSRRLYAGNLELDASKSIPILLHFGDKTLRIHPNHISPIKAYLQYLWLSGKKYFNLYIISILISIAAYEGFRLYFPHHLLKGLGIYDSISSPSSIGGLPTRLSDKNGVNCVMTFVKLRSSPNEQVE